MGRHGNRAPVGRDEVGVDGTPRRWPGDIKTSERKREVRSVKRDILRYKKVRKKRKRDVLRYKNMRKRRKRDVLKRERRSVRRYVLRVGRKRKRYVLKRKRYVLR